MGSGSSNIAAAKIKNAGALSGAKSARSAVKSAQPSVYVKTMNGPEKVRTGSKLYNQIRERGQIREQATRAVNPTTSPSSTLGMANQSRLRIARQAKAAYNKLQEMRRNAKSDNELVVLGGMMSQQKKIYNTMTRGSKQIKEKVGPLES